MDLLSKKARHALHGVAYIALHGKRSPVPLEAVLAYLKDYSGRVTLSPGYIAKVFQELSRAGVITAVPGPGGGYSLARPASRVHLIEIIEALDGPVVSRCCLLSAGACPVEEHCGVGAMLRAAERAFYDFFKKKTVQTLARKMPPSALVAPAPNRRRRGAAARD